MSARQPRRRWSLEPLEGRWCPSAFRFAVIGDYGSNRPESEWVADLVNSWKPEFVITVGDNNYLPGDDYDLAVGKNWHGYINDYQGEYGDGSPTPRFFPALGNHDWPHLEEYQAFFTLPGNERYYNFTWESVEFFVVNSNLAEPDGRAADSIQAAWLRDALAASTADFQVVYFHHPPYTSGLPYGNDEQMQWPFAEWGADAVFTGHEHLYERLEVDGIPHFVNGLGGHSSIYRFDDPIPESRFRFREFWGAMLVTVIDRQMTFEFHATDDQGLADILIDSHTIHAAGVAGRHMFYNDSVWDGFDLDANADDDEARAFDKSPLLPGQSASFANYTAHPDGVTGIMVDLARAAGATEITAADFSFRVGNNDNPASWTPAPLPASISMRPAAGEGGSDRVSIVWPVGSIVNEWLEVTVNVTAATALAQPDIHYWGSAVGDTGDIALGVPTVVVDFADEWHISRNTNEPPIEALVDNPFDLNRDGIIDFADQDVVITNANGIRADLDRDGRVSLADLVYLQTRFGDVASSSLDGDLSFDGFVDAADAAVLANEFGNTTPESMAASRLVLFTAPQVNLAPANAPAAIAERATRVKRLPTREADAVHAQAVRRTRSPQADAGRTGEELSEAGPAESSANVLAAVRSRYAAAIRARHLRLR